MSKNQKVEAITPEIRNLALSQLEKSQSWPMNLTGQTAYYEVARSVLQAIADGKTWAEIQKVFKSNPIPGSFSQVGAWMPRELHRAIGRILCTPDGEEDTIFIQKVAGFRTGETRIYRECGELEAEGKDPKWDTAITGVYVRCSMCDAVYASKEPAHQLYCPKCDSKRLKAKKGGVTRVAMSKLPASDKKIIAFAGSILRERTSNPKRAGIALNNLNVERAAIGKSELTMEDVASAKSVADLLK